MDVRSIAVRHADVLNALSRQMTMTGKWSGAPGLLDELHALRRQYHACQQRPEGNITSSAAPAPPPSRSRESLS
jgi:hypothetical protein